MNRITQSDCLAALDLDCFLALTVLQLGHAHLAVIERFELKTHGHLAWNGKEIHDSRDGRVVNDILAHTAPHRILYSKTKP